MGSADGGLATCGGGPATYDGGTAGAALVLAAVVRRHAVVVAWWSSDREVARRRWGRRGGPTGCFDGLGGMALIGSGIGRARFSNILGELFIGTPQ